MRLLVKMCISCFDERENPALGVWTVWILIQRFKKRWSFLETTRCRVSVSGPDTLQQVAVGKDQRSADDDGNRAL